jgi:lysophospholipase L1-like esterase
MNLPMRNCISTLSLLVFLLASSQPLLLAEKNAPLHWVGTWAASPVPIDNGKGPLGEGDYTLREIVHTSIAGQAFRLVLSNEMGTTPLSVAAVRVEFDADRTQPSLQRQVTFGGKGSVLIPFGTKVYSDSLTIALPAQSSLTVSLFIPKQAIAVLTMHAYANQPNFMAAGDQTLAATLSQPVESDSWLLLTAVEVQASAQAASVVTLGDSITDGAVSTRGANLRWPDDLARRLQSNSKTSHLAVLNEGIGGNRILHSDIGSNAGPSTLNRFDRDVLSQAGVKYLIILEGINDIGVGTGPTNPHDTVTPEELTFALSQLVERAHTHGIKVYLGTIMPDKGLSLYYTETGEAERQAVNRWIRANTLSDGVIDFDKAVRDPADPQRLLAAFDGGDHIHPSDAGHQAMADAIDLSLFTR